LGFSSYRNSRGSSIWYNTLESYIRVSSIQGKRKNKSLVLLAEKIKFCNSMKYYLVAEVSNSFSTINISEFNEILVGLFAVVIILLNIYLRNSFQNIIKSFKSFYFFVSCKES
jgi:hypothetical protein